MRLQNCVRFLSFHPENFHIIFYRSIILKVRTMNYFLLAESNSLLDNLFFVTTALTQVIVIAGIFGGSKNKAKMDKGTKAKVTQDLEDINNSTTPTRLLPKWLRHEFRAIKNCIETEEVQTYPKLSPTAFRHLLGLAEDPPDIMFGNVLFLFWSESNDKSNAIVLTTTHIYFLFDMCSTFYIELDKIEEIEYTNKRLTIDGKEILTSYFFKKPKGKELFFETLNTIITGLSKESFVLNELPMMPTKEQLAKQVMLVKCPCGAVNKVSTKHKGKHIKCPKCSTRLKV